MTESNSPLAGFVVDVHDRAREAGAGRAETERFLDRIAPQSPPQA
jgi:hypothetical protein